MRILNQGDSLFQRKHSWCTPSNSRLSVTKTQAMTQYQQAYSIQCQVFLPGWATQMCHISWVPPVGQITRSQKRSWAHDHTVADLEELVAFAVWRASHCWHEIRLHSAWPTLLKFSGPVSIDSKTLSVHFIDAVSTHSRVRQAKHAWLWLLVGIVTCKVLWVTMMPSPLKVFILPVVP